MSQPSRLDQHWKTLRRSKSNPDLLTHADLYDSAESAKTGKAVYKRPVVKVVDVSIGLVKSQDKPNGEEMVFLHFQGVRRKLGLNSGNSRTMEQLTGRAAPSGWVGATIQLYVDPQAKYPKGEKGPAIRIRPTRPSGQAEADPMPNVPEEDRERLESEQAERLGERQPGEDG